MTIRSPGKRLGPALILAISVFCLTAHSFEIPESIKKQLLGTTEEPGAAIQPTGSEALDNSIDPETYVVGGGDGFRISIVGLPSQGWTPIIGADGDIYQGELGVIRMGRLSLRQAVDSLSRHVRAVLKRDYKVHVTLNRVKTPVITVSGVVTRPGTYSLPGNRRLLDAIKLANGNEMPKLDQADFRSVTVANRDSTRTYDLLRFLSRNDLAHNPYVYPGDNIQLRNADARVYITGEVLAPVAGWIPIHADETLAGLLDIVQRKRTADPDRILIQQASTGAKAKSASVSPGEAAGLTLGNGDVITFPLAGTFRTLDTAVVSGEVLRPGTYPIIVGVTTVADLLREAGGATESANPGRAYVIRTSKLVEANNSLAEEIDREKALLNRQMGAYVQMVRPEFNAALMEMRQSGDFSILELGDGATTVRVEEGDRIHIPKREKHVYVSGAVANPGAYPYEAGKGHRHYVELAGGYAPKAKPNGSYAIALYGGVSKVKAVDRLAEGDVLVVPSTIEYKTYSAVFLPLIQTVPAVLSLILSILILSKQ